MGYGGGRGQSRGLAIGFLFCKYYIYGFKVEDMVLEEEERVVVQEEVEETMEFIGGRLESVVCLG